jgi:ATP-dependent DNA ligase
MKNSVLRLPKRKAEFIEPMECAPVTKLLDGPEWVYEIKLDGYRAIAVKSTLALTNCLPSRTAPTAGNSSRAAFDLMT